MFGYFIFLSCVLFTNPIVKNVTKHFGPSNRSPAVFPIKKGQFVRKSKTCKLATAVKHAAVNAFKPLDGKPLCVKAQLELHNQKVRPKPLPVAIITNTTVPSEPSTDADEIELSILDQDLLLSESDPDTNKKNRHSNKTGV